MPSVYVSIGSNIEQRKNILASLEALNTLFGDLALSSVYESEAVGFGGDNFYNLVAVFGCDLSVGDLSVALRQIEAENGRRRDGPKFSSRTLDIDILTYGDLIGEIDGIQLPRDEILENAFVLLPMAEIAGEKLHPKIKKSYNELWLKYDRQKQKLWPITFSWRGKQLPSPD